MNNEQQMTQPISDDQELAKVLAGVNQEVGGGLSFDEPAEQIEQVEMEPIAEPVAAPSYQPVESINSNIDNLDNIKKDALFELRPLVEKLNLVPDEKFDIYLLLLRSSDDKALIAPAYEAAKNIQDDTRKAQALLDIIKEIDFLTNSAA